MNEERRPGVLGMFVSLVAAFAAGGMLFVGVAIFWAVLAGLVGLVIGAILGSTIVMWIVGIVVFVSPLIFLAGS
jgi:hypothetical protein